MKFKFRILTSVGWPHVLWHTHTRCMIAKSPNKQILYGDQSPGVDTDVFQVIYTKKNTHIFLYTQAWISYITQTSDWSCSSLLHPPCTSWPVNHAQTHIQLPVICCHKSSISRFDFVRQLRSKHTHSSYNIQTQKNNRENTLSCFQDGLFPNISL